MFQPKLDVLPLAQRAIWPLVYFKGGDLDALPAEVKRDLENAVRQVRNVAPYGGVKTPIGTV